MSHKNKGIILIGPVCVGKSTQGRLVSQALNKPLVSLDPIAHKYYEQNGLSGEELRQSMAEHGFLQTLRQRWWPSVAFAAEQVVYDHPNCVIDFGAGYSHYEDEALFARVQKAVAGYGEVVLMLPSPDLDESVAILKARSMESRGTDWVRDGYDFIEHWVKDDCNERLATVTIYTEGKTPEETCDDILAAISVGI
ncbi:MAG: shikimate kinase [Chloroflexota bacterium]